jgi:hypothetical protein
MRKVGDKIKQKQVNALCKGLQDAKLDKLYRTHAEVWQENETSIVLKMLGDSLKTKDESRTDALQRSLLKIEHSTELGPSEKLEEPDTFMLPPSEFTLGKFLVYYKDCNEFSRNVLPAADTAGSVELPNKFSASEKEYLEKVIRQNLKQYDVQVQITIVGNEMTGKTSVTSALIGSKFKLNTPHSTG